MIKKIMKSMMAVVLMLTSIFTIAACSCANQAKIKFEEYTDEGINYITVYTASEEDTSSEPKQVWSLHTDGKKSTAKVEKGSYVVLTLHLQSDQYEINDFKILKDGEELSRLSLANMPNNAFGDAKYLYTVGKVEDSIEITFEGHTKLKEYTASAVVNDFEDYKNDDRTKDIRFQLLVNGEAIEYDSKTEFTGGEISDALASKVLKISDEVKLKVYYKNKDKLPNDEIINSFIRRIPEDSVIYNVTNDYEIFVDVGYFYDHNFSINYGVFEEVTLDSLTNMTFIPHFYDSVFESLFGEGTYKFLITINGTEVEKDVLAYSDLHKSTNLKLKFKSSVLMEHVLMDNETFIGVGDGIMGSDEVEKTKISSTPISGDEDHVYITIDFGNYKSINDSFDLNISRINRQEGGGLVEPISEIDGLETVTINLEAVGLNTQSHGFVSSGDNQVIDVSNGAVVYVPSLDLTFDFEIIPYYFSSGFADSLVVTVGGSSYEFEKIEEGGTQIFINSNYENVKLERVYYDDLCSYLYRITIKDASANIGTISVEIETVGLE